MIYAVVDRRTSKWARVSDPSDEGNMVPGGWICTHNVALDFIGGTGSMSLQHTSLLHMPSISAMLS